MPGSFLYIDEWELALRFGCALLAGFALGLDREIRDRRVGVRTYMLVSLGAAAYTIITMELATQLSGQDISSDPTRITQGLIGAIGFLGAGAIIQGQGRVGGLATAASLWVSGAVGMASGLGYYTHAVGISVLVAVLLGVSRLMDGRGAEDRPDLDREREEGDD